MSVTRNRNGLMYELPDLDQRVRESEGYDDEYDSRLFLPHVTVGLFASAIALIVALLWIATR